MARKKKEEEATEEMEQAEEAAPAGHEFVPEAVHKPKSDVYTAILILSFIAFLAGCIVSGREAWEHYDVQFWVFDKTKKGQQAEQPATTSTEESSASEPAKTNP
jgi:hypothetical protein